MKLTILYRQVNNFSKTLPEPQTNADEGEMLIEWPHRRMNFFTAKGTKTMTDESVLLAEGEFFAVMGEDMRKFLAVVGFYRDNMDKKTKIDNLRSLLCHYNEELTQENPENRILTSVLVSRATDKWIELTECVATPGLLIKGTVGDIINSLMMRIDSEILPASNVIISKLYRLKSALGEKLSNEELIQAIVKATGPYLWHECTMGRVVSRDGKLRMNLGIRLDKIIKLK